MNKTVFQMKRFVFLLRLYIRLFSRWLQVFFFIYQLLFFHICRSGAAKNLILSCFLATKLFEVYLHAYSIQIHWNRYSVWIGVDFVKKCYAWAALEYLDGKTLNWDSEWRKKKLKTGIRIGSHSPVKHHDTHSCLKSYKFIWWHVLGRCCQFG